MNVYEWLASPDVREHLEKNHYEFTLPEAFYVIRENRQRALEEKFAAWEELMDAMPDCLFSCETDSGEKIETNSFHESVRAFIEQQRELLEDVLQKDETGVYEFCDPLAPREGKGISFQIHMSFSALPASSLTFQAVQWPAEQDSTEALGSYTLELYESTRRE